MTSWGAVPEHTMPCRTSSLNLRRLQGCRDACTDGPRVASEPGGVARAAGLLPFHFGEPGSDIGQLWIEHACLVECGARFGKLLVPQAGVPTHKGLER